MSRVCRLLTTLLLLAATPPVLDGQESFSVAEAAKQIRRTFERLDRNGDQKLTVEEFYGREGDPRVLARDFVLYDFDASGYLSSVEFATVSGLVAPAVRGRVPDPFDALVDAAVAALDESYEGWNQRPSELVNAHTFVANFLGSISPGSKLFVTGRILRQADQDADGRLSRTEAKQFLKQQLGYRWYPGPPLREETGRLVRFDRFLEMDADQSGSLTEEEFQAYRWDRRDIEQRFDAQDRDGNGQISYEEFADPRSPQFYDPIEWFRKADVTLDAFLDLNELFDASDTSRRHLVASTMASFDLNGDARLTLNEYRMSMHANVNFSWHRQPVDKNRDGRLNYDEFVFHDVQLFHLQRRYFFHRLDRDASGELDSTEFPFESRLPDAVRLGSFSPEKPVDVSHVPSQASTSRLLFRDPEFPHCGWPVLSPDGTAVLFHRQRPDATDKGEVVRVAVESGEIEVLSDGVQPSWSRDGSRFVCRQNRERSEIWMLDSTGAEIKCLGPGTAAKWSDSGRYIAILHDNGLSLYDVDTAESRSLLRREDHNYQSLGDDIAWAPDGRHVVVAARTPLRSSLVRVDVESAEQSVLFQTDKNRLISGHLDWSHPLGVVFRVHDGIQQTSKLLCWDPERGRAVAPVLSGTVGWKSACVSPDGMWYTAVSGD